jgi:hypothetical protein
MRPPWQTAGAARHVALVEAGKALELALGGGRVHALASTALLKPLRCMCTSWSISTSPVARMSPANL